MNIFDYCDAINAEIRIIRYPNQDERWSASFEYCEIKESPDDPCLAGAYGDGKTPLAALADYIDRVSGKVLVFHAMSKTLRRDLICPKNLTVPL